MRTNTSVTSIHQDTAPSTHFSPKGNAKTFQTRQFGSTAPIETKRAEGGQYFKIGGANMPFYAVPKQLHLRESIRAAKSSDKSSNKGLFNFFRKQPQKSQESVEQLKLKRLEHKAQAREIMGQLQGMLEVELKLRIGTSYTGGAENDKAIRSKAKDLIKTFLLNPINEDFTHLIDSSPEEKESEINMRVSTALNMILKNTSALDKEHTTLKVRDRMYASAGVAAVAAGVTATVFCPPAGGVIATGLQVGLIPLVISGIDPRADTRYDFSDPSQNAKPAFLNLSHSFYQAGVA
jgi:hypothetical protein